MTTETTNPENLQPDPEITTEAIAAEALTADKESVKKPDSYVKLAMRNMVRKRGKSLQHFFLSTVGLLVLFIGLAYLTR
jgi:Protein of unknown function (DUF3285)